jgi:hypothetical protein
MTPSTSRSAVENVGTHSISATSVSVSVFPLFVCGSFYYSFKRLSFFRIMATDYQSVFVNQLLYIIFNSIKLLRTKVLAFNLLKCG